MASRGLFLCLSLALVQVALGGFTADLLHRDSPQSPLYNSSATLYDRWRLAAERSLERARRFATRDIDTASIVSPVVGPVVGEYIMTLSLGTPPFKIHAITDTGSDLIWTNCIPCPNCYHQDDPLFDPKNSKSYSNVPYDSKTCKALKAKSMDANDVNCEYKLGYGDGSRISGLLAKEDITLAATSGDKASLKSIVFGCNHESTGVFDSSTGGIVGLGYGELSLVSQLGDTINNQFSYCLLPHSKEQKSSRLVFGPDNRAPKGMPKTPLIKNPAMSSHYNLNLKKIIVGGKSIPVPSAPKGNIVIDSGTTFTILKKSVIDAVTAEVKKSVKLPPVTDPKYNMYPACFAYDGKQEVNFPEFIFAFEGADVPVKQHHMMDMMDENVLCLDLLSAESTTGNQIYGNTVQQNFYVRHDLKQRQLYIAPADCANI